MENSEVSGVPLKALWPPISLITADLALMIPAYLWTPAVFQFLLFGGLAILAFDLRGRRIDFRIAKKHIENGRNPSRVAKTYQFSWCGRVACQHAAWAAGNEKGGEVERYYRECGYRWYHIFPDRTFTLQSPFLTVRFWEATLTGNRRPPVNSVETLEIVDGGDAAFDDRESEKGRIRSAA
jgi:hypothetical protein